MFFLDDVARSVIMLVNTIYFNGYWVEQFAKNETNAQSFWLTSKTAAPAQFMIKTGNFYYGESVELDAKILRLPYKVNKQLVCAFISSKKNSGHSLFSFYLYSKGWQIRHVYRATRQSGWN